MPYGGYHATDVVACVFDGGVYCPRHCPDAGACVDHHGAVFAGAEVDCAPDCCETCSEPIDGQTVLHHQTTGGACAHCGVTPAGD